MLARFANDWRSVVDQFDSIDGIVADEIADCICRDMAEMSVESVNVDLNTCGCTCCDECMFNLE